MVSKPAVASSHTALHELAAKLAGLSFAALAPATQDSARQRIFDTLGAMALGLATPEGRMLQRYAARGDGLRAPGRLERCRVYVGATRSTEIDDIDIASCTTVGAVVVPVALVVAAGDARGDDARLLASTVAGYEAMMRLGRAIGGATLLYRGVWPTYVTAAFAAAATAAKLLELDGAATARALALTLARTAAPPAAALTRFGFRYYALGCAAAEGADAAVAAAAGVDADSDGLSAFAERLGARFDAAALTAGCGEPWLIQAVDTKLWPTSRQALASVAAFMQLVPQTVAPDDIERITVDLPTAYRSMVDRPTVPTQRIESLLGVQYQLGLAAFAPERLYDALRPSLPTDERIASLMAKVELRADDTLSGRFPELWGSRVTLRLRSGATTSAEVLEPPGSGRQPLPWALLDRKLTRIFAASGRPACAAELHDLGERCRAIGAAERASAVELLTATAALGGWATP